MRTAPSWAKGAASLPNALWVQLGPLLSVSLVLFLPLGAMLFPLGKGASFVLPSGKNSRADFISKRARLTYREGANATCFDLLRSIFFNFSVYSQIEVSMDSSFMSGASRRDPLETGLPGRKQPMGEQPWTPQWNQTIVIDKQEGGKRPIWWPFMLNQITHPLPVSSQAGGFWDRGLVRKKATIKESSHWNPVRSGQFSPAAYGCRRCARVSLWL